MQPAQPFHSYLLWLLLQKGDGLDPETWDDYGRELWDYACFLDANGLTWNQAFDEPGDSVFGMYRDWQINDLELCAKTINRRLRRAAHMYEWALSLQMIERLPFGYEQVTRHGIEHDLAHKTGGTSTTQKVNMLVDEWKEEPAFLTSSQIQEARKQIFSMSQGLLFDLMVRVGLRSVEARTFPLKYVFDPRSRNDLKPGVMIYVRLDPRDMTIKFDKRRTVAVPYGLMEDLWAYTQFERIRLGGCDSQKEMILSAHGTAYTRDGVVKAFRRLSKRVGFRASALMLRHSYAIYTYLVLSKHPELNLEPLITVRDRLGHESVETTMIYLQQIQRLMGDAAEQLMQEFDDLYDVTPTLSRSASPPATP